MSKIRIVTDTNASLPAAIVKKYGIFEVPIHIQFGEESYITGADIDDAKLFELIDARKVLPTTAAPSPAAFQKAFETALAEGVEQVLCVCCSSKVSATYQAALMGAESFPDGAITIVDSLNLCLAEGFQVIAAAETAAKGASMEAVLAAIHSLQARTHVYAALPTLKYLAMGGRMGKLAAGFGETLNIKPILTSKEGKLDLLEKVRTWRKAKQRLIELALESSQGSEVERLALIHVNNEAGAMALYDMIKEVLPISVEPIVTDFTPGLSVHTGSGVIGFVMVTKPD